MFTFIRFIVRRFSNGRLKKSRWFRRLLLAITVVRWLQNRLTRPESVVLAKGEILEVGISRKEGVRK